MTIGKGKRQRGPNQLAKWVVDRSTDETPEPEHALNPAAVAAPQFRLIFLNAVPQSGARVVRSAGSAASKTMTPAAGRKVVAKAAKVRWGRDRSPGAYRHSVALES